MDSREIARTFVTARREATGLSAYPGAIPADLAEAYRIQDAAIELRTTDGGRIVGWKAGLIAPALRVAGGDERLVGPIWEDTVWPLDKLGDRVEMPVYGEGFAAVEAEFVVRLATTIESGTWTAEQVAAMPQTVHAGIEIASSPLAAINDLGPCVTASDFGNNHGLIVGAEIASGTDLGALAVRTEIDGQTVGDATGASIPGGIHTALAQTLSVLGRRGLVVQAGTFFATGAVTGVHRAHVGQQAVVTFAGLPPLHCRLVAARG